MADRFYDDTPSAFEEGVDKLAFWARLTRVGLVAALPVIGVDIILCFAVISGQLATMSEQTLISIDRYLIPFGWFGIALFFATAFCFGRWIYLAASNLIEADAPDFDYTPGWSVGWYFIPIANLWKPFQAMRQIWNGSEMRPGSYIDDNAGILSLWWATWLSSGILGNISQRMITNPASQDIIVTGYTVGLLAGLINLILYPTALRLVSTITHWQLQRESIATVFE